ncbi:MAG: type I restriction-modification enzyme R subunit C-terminal domain-containing protein, partial [Selenomonadaceae bacterium]
DFSDEVQEGEGEKLRPPTASESYRQKVEFYLKEHMDNAAVYKLRHNEPMTMSDMRELERIFWQELGTREDYAQNYENEPLGELVRRIVGMDEESVRDAFREFLTENRLSRSQMDFVEKIIQYIARNGSIDVEPSKEPFRGVDLTKLFKGKESVWHKIFGRIKEITSNSIVAA